MGVLPLLIEVHLPDAARWYADADAPALVSRQRAAAGSVRMPPFAPALRVVGGNRSLSELGKAS